MNQFEEEAHVAAGQEIVPDPLAVWQRELAQHDPRSYEYHQLAAALADLAAEMHIGDILTDPPELPDASGLPAGFVARSRPVNLAEVPGDQFYHTVPSLYNPAADYLATVEELRTDADGRVRIVDLRPVLGRRVKDIDPPPTAFDHVDGYFYRDMKVFADTGRPRHTITLRQAGRSNVCYTRVNGSKMRVFWMPVETRNYSGEGVRVVARIVDSGDSDHTQRTVYNRVFGIVLRT
ncbi:MAG TPA: hypothetical protein VF466_00240 [Candidatus Saccharimonadales bacterium]